ncbi:uncharacterized protein SPAPADRAFT_60117 [Spathaspora passalidarum NRRL Y-27907]|uniref:Uncharacterized protein n=1 Tax=Spathaspora passalidarum (strain NRRL Y-27907 / 11-Y1) TaxID=619300 RepID=G3AM61_SPAPN|nr:uncharacterized protein SPAPADRAFT_60117 [Spathaspora passalidarum NRRL Y-27907]EGW32766.1 hypothetical protein SPAPADRAFT_60117 [Spathaspora passalidarum NRRL Y-27907]
MPISTELPLGTDPGQLIPPPLPISDQYISPIPGDTMVMPNFESPNTTGDAFPPSHNHIELTPQIIQGGTFQTPNPNESHMISQSQVIYHTTEFAAPYDTPVVHYQDSHQYHTPKKVYPPAAPMSVPLPSTSSWDGQSPIMSNFAPLRESTEAIGLGLSIEQSQVDDVKSRYIQQVKQQEYHRLLMETQNQLQESHVTHPEHSEIINDGRMELRNEVITAPVSDIGHSDGDKSFAGASPTTIDAVSSQSSPNAVSESITEEERLFNEISTPLNIKNEDLLGQFVDLEYGYPSSSSDLDQVKKNFEFTDYFAIEDKPKHDGKSKKKKAGPSTKVTKKTLKKSPSFTGNSSSPTFIVNQRWNKSHSDIQTKKLEAYSKANQLSFNECSQKIPLFALSSHYSFVYENVDTINDGETHLARSKSSNNVMIDHANFEKSSSNQLKSLESGLIEFKVDLKGSKK